MSRPPPLSRTSSPGRTWATLFTTFSATRLEVAESRVGCAGPALDWAVLAGARANWPTTTTAGHHLVERLISNLRIVRNTQPLPSSGWRVVSLRLGLDYCDPGAIVLVGHRDLNRPVPRSRIVVPKHQLWELLEEALGTGTITPIHPY